MLIRNVENNISQLKTYNKSKQRPLTLIQLHVLRRFSELLIKCLNIWQKKQGENRVCAGR